MLQYLNGQWAKHKLNIENLLTNTTALAEHPDLAVTIEEELGKMAEYEDKIAVLQKHFSV